MNVVLLTAFVAQMASGAMPTEVELSTARTWAAAKFEQIPESTERPGNRLEVIANNDPVQLNARAGKPMRIGKKSYTRGLYCHAVSKVIVSLERPAQRFEAVVGVDSNDTTSGGRGSVVFSVTVNGKKAWSSPLLKEGTAPLPVSLELGGAKQFILEVADGGDGIACDQADWADAKVLAADGSEVWLGDFDLVAQQRALITADPMFSFEYGGKLSTGFLSSWKFAQRSKKLDPQRTQYTQTYSDPKTGLVVRCVGVEYHDFPTVEWTLHFKNTGTADTPILSNILPLDTAFTRDCDAEFILHHHTGDNCTADSFEPHADALPANSDRTIANAGGRPTTGAWPYFNIETPTAGLIAAVSWAGQWKAQFTRDAGNGLRLRAGQELTHFTLHPGEEVRTPMIALQFYKGPRLHAQNVWRQWMIAHNMPRPGGKQVKTPLLLACSSHQYAEMINADSKSQMFFIDKYLERGIKLDYWWMDAGWYINKTGWPNTGTWKVDTKRFPGGLRPITDHARSKGLKNVVWFEPERVTAGTWLTTEHPEWIHGGANGGLLDLGNPEAHKWLVEHIDSLITSEGIELYRQDFNMDPLGHWRANDTEDRQGITEIRHVEGYFAYWDELRRRHPGLLIDSCASGGRRNDLETLRRALPLLRSDYIMEPVGNQGHSHALPLWFPFYGTGTSRTDTYSILSVLSPNFIACWDMRDASLDYERLAGIVTEWQTYGANFYGDYYPVMPYSLDNHTWIAWQFNRPDAGKGMLQVFRRSDSPFEVARLRLHGLKAEARYSLRATISGATWDMTGADLMKGGLRLAMKECPGAEVVVYEEKR